MIVAVEIRTMDGSVHEEAEAEDDILQEGILLKRGRVSGIWRSRYVVLTKTKLLYYLNRLRRYEEPMHPRGELNVGADFLLTTVGHDERRWSVSDGNTTLSFSAPDATEGRIWCDTILTMQELYDEAAAADAAEDGEDTYGNQSLNNADLSHFSISGSMLTPGSVTSYPKTQRRVSEDWSKLGSTLVGFVGESLRRFSLSSSPSLGASDVHDSNEDEQEVVQRKQQQEPTRRASMLALAGAREEQRGSGASVRLALLSEKCEHLPELPAAMVAEQYERAELFLKLHGSLLPRERRNEFDRWRDVVAKTKDKEDKNRNHNKATTTMTTASSSTSSSSASVAAQALLVLTLTQLIPTWACMFPWEDEDGELEAHEEAAALVSPEAIISMLTEHEVTAETLVALRQALSFPDGRWLQLWLSLGGHEILLETLVCLLSLAPVSFTLADSEALYGCFACIRALVKNSSGMDEFVRHTPVRTLNRICRAFRTSRTEGLCQLLLEVLTSMCQVRFNSIFSRTLFVRAERMDAHIYIYICVCVCVCVSSMLMLSPRTF